MSGKGRHRRTRRVVIAVILVLAAGAATAAAANGYGWRNASDDEPAGSTLPAKTAPVTRQTLADTQNESGELGYGTDVSVAARLSGTLTAIPAGGTAVARGEALYRVDNTPVVLLYGGLPAYRTLASGVEGPDVKQFEENLAALGYGGFTVDEEYTSATANAVQVWQEDLGLTETGTVEPGRIVYAGGAVRVAATSIDVGGAVQPGATVLSYTGRSRAVTVDLDVSEQRMAKIGNSVTVKLPDGKTVNGKIASAESVIVAAENPQEDDTTKIRVGITVDDEKAVEGLDQAAVTVTFVASQREKVLTVPVAALLALAEGGYGVQVVENGTSRIVAVETGMFAAGRVEISGEGIAEGTVVGMPS
ncbi:peptidoglycan-binding protein [Virgisporangium aliadipatigenens]|uniref:Peptidoglycan-binding protein n=1 Tax=Virgisporangium aliadipatigenens TaxID=741659 RepID=A0A8J3YW48_9ACTN|nr:peptidoglycan-binding protein [Virgisporangium aliadipatigenens]GIJ50886.1 peptidoglycan-binding protein [Virgisporangium aliadipatigenens]